MDAWGISEGYWDVAGAWHPIDEGVQGIIEGLAGVREVRAEGRQLRSRVESGARAIPQILSALDRSGIAVEAVDSHRPSLDDVYLHFTGRDFRSEDEASTE